MPFVLSVREKLIVLKQEFEAGILPQIIYEEMCRRAIDVHGRDIFLLDGMAWNLEIRFILEIVEKAIEQIKK